MEKRIKEVNGVKVIRRYGAGSIFSGLICLALCAIPVLLLFLPWMTFSAGTETSYSINMLQCLKATFGETNDVKTKVFDVLASGNSWMGVVYNAMTIGGVILLGCLILFDLVLLFLALEYLFRGKVGHFKLAYVISIFSGITVALWNGISLALMLVFKLKLFGFEVGMYHNFIYTGASIVATILLAILYSSCFKNRVFIGDLGDLRHYQGGESTSESSETQLVTKEVVKVRYEPAKGLPPRLSSIGGHAFSQNMNLEVAMIPNGITSLGQAAFSNCGNLKIVSLPLSVKSIGFNCFWNCKNLKRFNYAGSKEQWRHVKRGSNWLTKAGTYTVVCNDGPIIVNPYH